MKSTKERRFYVSYLIVHSHEDIMLNGSFFLFSRQSKHESFCIFVMVFFVHGLTRPLSSFTSLTPHLPPPTPPPFLSTKKKRDMTDVGWGNTNQNGKNLFYRFRCDINLKQVDVSVYCELWIYEHVHYPHSFYMLASRR